MSSTLNGIFITGVTGLHAQSVAMGTISDNIANARSIGYKRVDTEFATLVGAQTSIPNYAWGGVSPVNLKRIDSQGLLLASNESTHMAVSGKGLFAVAEAVDTASGTVAATSDRLVTRAGDFQIDRDGYFVNSSGFYLLGVNYTNGQPVGGAATDLEGLQPLRLTSGNTLAGSATTEVRVSANLPAQAEVGDTHTAATSVYDAQGRSYALSHTFTKTGTNAWSVALTDVVPGFESDPPVTATFNSPGSPLAFGSDGALASPTTPVNLGSAVLSNGVTLSPSFVFNQVTGSGGLTQYSDSFAQVSSTSDGQEEGYVTGIEIAEDGTASVRGSNGASLAIGRIPLVSFANINGLEPRSGTTFALTDDAGEAIVSFSGDDNNRGGVGEISAGLIEQSTVDLADEFSNMIVTQQAYGAASKIITTADDMYKTVGQLAR